MALINVTIPPNATINVNVKFDREDELFSLLNQIKMDVNEAIQKLNDQGVQLDKVYAEVQTVKNELAAALAAGQTVPQGLVDAINAVGTKIQAIDDLNPDTQATPV